LFSLLAGTGHTGSALRGQTEHILLLHSHGSARGWVDTAGGSSTLRSLLVNAERSTGLRSRFAGHALTIPLSTEAFSVGNKPSLHRSEGVNLVLPVFSTHLHELVLCGKLLISSALRQWAHFFVLASGEVQLLTAEAGHDLCRLFTGCRHRAVVWWWW
jgi:hypothetical protein